MAWLNGWDNRKSITLSRASGAVTNYQMKLLLGESSGATGEDVDCGALCATDFDDIRFTASDGTTLLDYWIESVTGTTPNQLATIWIEFNSIGTGATTFFMYYGNSGAAAVSNGANTFPFFDHFDGASLNTGIWTLGDGSVTQSSSIGRLVWVSTSDYTQIYGKTTFGANYRFRSLCKYAANNVYASFGFQNTSVCGAIFQTNYLTASVLNSLNRNPYPTETAGNLGNVGHNAYNIFDIKRNSTVSDIYSINDIVVSTLSTNVPSTAVPPWYEGYEQNVYIDWVFVSQYLATEPVWGSWGSVENEVIELIPSTSITPTLFAPTTVPWQESIPLLTITPYCYEVTTSPWQDTTTKIDITPQLFSPSDLVVASVVLVETSPTVFAPSYEQGLFTPCTFITPTLFNPTCYRPPIITPKANVTWTMTPNNKRFTRIEV